MRVMVLVKATMDSEAGAIAVHGADRGDGPVQRVSWSTRGSSWPARGLQPSANGKRVAFDGPRRTVVDGPFAATRELVAGFWLWQVGDMAEAVAWVKRCPNPMPGPSENRDSAGARGAPTSATP